MPYLFDSAIAAAAEESITFNQSKKPLKLRHVYCYGSRMFLPVSVQVKIGEQWRKVQQQFLAVYSQDFKLDLEVDDEFRITFENLTAGDDYTVLCLVQPVIRRRTSWRW